MAQTPSWRGELAAALRLGWPLVALVMGIVIGPIIENRLRETLSLGDGSPMILLERPITVAILILCAVMVLAPLRRRFRKRRPSPQS